MTNKHTPGPWKSDIVQVTREFFKGGRLVEGITTESGQIVAITGEGDADARLIAAAPDLLAALQRLVSGCDNNADADGNVDMDMAMFAEARAAIAKAGA